MSMSVVHAVSSLERSHGGPSKSVTGLCDALAITGFLDQLSLLVPNIGESQTSIGCRNACVEDLHMHHRVHGKYRRVDVENYRKVLHMRAPDIVHDHGIWHPFNNLVAKNLPTKSHYIVQPRGMLEPWALEHKKIKKNIAWKLYQHRNLERADIFFATAEQEATNIRQLGFRQPIAVVPNGIELGTPPRRVLRTGKKTALFMSRIHPKKGLTDLIKAWALLRPDDWELVIAGPDECGFKQELVGLAVELNVSDKVSFLDAVYGPDKQALWSKADLFVFPTYSENFGLVVAEALAQGVPVITTKGAPWEGLRTHDCGWWIELGNAPLVGAIREAMSKSAPELVAMGERGKKYVSRYNWPSVAEQALKVYRWLLSGGTTPSNVLLD